MAYTASKIYKLTKPGSYSLGSNLYVDVKSKTNKYWYIRWSDNNQRKLLYLGSINEISYQDARGEADIKKAELVRKRREVRLNRDHESVNPPTKLAPVIETSTSKSAPYQILVDQFMQYKEPELSEKNQHNWRAALKRFGDAFGQKSLDDITSDEIYKVLNATWHKTTHMTSRGLTRLEKFYDWAIALGHYKGSNPARWLGYFEYRLPNPSTIAPSKSHPALPWKQVHDFWTELQSINSKGSKALQLLVLTGQRSGQIRKARWEDIDLETKTWTFPGINMKGKVKHEIPIDPILLKTLLSLETNGNGLLFPTEDNNVMSDNFISKTIRDMNHRRELYGKPLWVDPTDNRKINVHGFRTTFRTWSADKQLDRQASEFQIGHKLKDKVEAAYNRSNLIDIRRGIMDQWTRFVIT